MKKLKFLPIGLSGILFAASFAQADERSDAYYEAIAKAMNVGNFSTADSLLNEWKNAGIEPIERIFAEGHVAFRRGNPELGKQLTDSAISLNPKCLDYRTRRIREQYLAREKAEAFEGIRKLAGETAANPSDWEIDGKPIDMPANEAVCLLMSSHIYDHLGYWMRLDDVCQFADSVIASFPDEGEVPIKMAVGYILEDEGEGAEAAKIWEQILPKARQPELSILRAMLASYYGSIGDIERSSDLITTILDDPETIDEIREYIKANSVAKVDTLSYRQIQFNVLSYFASPLAPEWVTENLEHPEIILPQYLEGMNFASERDLSGITAEKYDVKADFGDSTAIIPVIVWTMPEPRDFIDCKYVAYVPDGDKLRYITLEKTLSMDGYEQAYIVCEAIFCDDTQGYNHINYGQITDDSVKPEEFAALAAQVVQKSRDTDRITEK